MTYVERVLEELKAKNPAQPEFIQAATEVLTSLTPVFEKHPEYEKAALLFDYPVLITFGNFLEE